MIKTEQSLNKAMLKETMYNVIPSQIKNCDIVFFCIGTDRSTGDSLGPLVGSFLKKNGYSNVIGTLEDTVNADNIEQKIREIPRGKSVVVIDSTLSDRQFIGKYFMDRGGISPGAGLGKVLPTVGDYSIKAVVNVNGPLSYHLLQSTKLSLVLKMAEEVVEAILSRFPLTSSKAYLYKTSWKISS